MQATTIKLFLVKGQPTGLRTAELSNWSGKAIAGPRSDLQALLQRQELSGAGVYLLTGNNPKDDAETLYIGEAEIVEKRLKQQREKDDWNHATVFVSKDDNLTKAHIRYLEGELIRLAQKANKAEVRNNASSGARLPEADKAEMDIYLDKMLQLLPVLGVRAFQLIPDYAPQRDEILTHDFKGLKSTGARTSGGFVVYQGSQAVSLDRPSPGVWGEKRNKLRESGVLIPEEDYLVFSRDIEFTSPSAAAAIIQGGPANGLTIWRNTSGQSLKEMELAAEK